MALLAIGSASLVREIRHLIPLELRNIEDDLLLSDKQPNTKDAAASQQLNSAVWWTRTRVIKKPDVLFSVYFLLLSMELCCVSKTFFGWECGATSSVQGSYAHV